MSDRLRAATPLTTASGQYRLCDWLVLSDIPLPELPAWSGDDRPHDLRITVGEVPALIEDAKLVTPVLQVDAAGRRARFHIEAVATFLVEDGRRITVQPRVALDAPDIRLFLLGTPFGLVCHQRGVLPLHAAAVEVDGEAVVFAGESGVGKSTLAAAFWRRGFPVIGDDVAPFLIEKDQVVVLPSLRRIRLWADSIRAAAWEPSTMERCREGIEKFSQPLGSNVALAPLRPRALIHLHTKTRGAGGTTFRNLRGREAAEWLGRQVYRAGSLHQVAGSTARITRITRVASAIPRHLVMARPLDFAELDQNVDMILETIRALK